MLRIRKVEPVDQYNANLDHDPSDIRTMLVTLVHEFDYGNVEVIIKMADRGNDPDLIDAAIRVAKAEFAKLIE